MTDKAMDDIFDIIMMIKGRIRFYSLFALFSLLISCDKGNESLIILNPWITYGSMSDQDGNTYKTILIGTQTWMAKNLTTTKFNDGTVIPLVTDAATWSNLSTPACCWQNNDPARKVTYGVLYNWYAINTGKLCPAGWHVPSDGEWTVLTDFLGGDNIAGSKLKESGFRHWDSPNTGSTDESAFSAYPGGKRLGSPDASFVDLRESGWWWTASSDKDWAVNRLMNYNSINTQKYFQPKNYGLSVRCVWNY